MSNANKILRGLLVLVVVAIMAVLIWRFASGLYLILSIVVAFLVAAGVASLAFRSSEATSARSIAKKSSDISQSGAIDDPALEVSGRHADGMSGAVDSDSLRIPIEPDVTDISPRMRRRLDHPDGLLRSVRSIEAKPDATEVAARYLRMSKTEEQSGGVSIPKPAGRITAIPSISKPMPADSPVSDRKVADPAVARGTAEASAATENDIAPQPETGGSPMPLVEDVSSLTDDEKNELVNAVWCRCENPYCKYTRFLGVHHLIDEKDGGTNRLDNLIVLCPYCHDLVHRSEIPEKEMRDWISNREERFKFKPNWHYF
jgi:hypothetical protein